jgi:hypothetical protein
VASVTEDPSNPGAIDVELEVALKDDDEPRQSALTTNRITPLPEQYRRFVYLNGAAEVFVRQLPLDVTP